MAKYTKTVPLIERGKYVTILVNKNNLLYEESFLSYLENGNWEVVREDDPCDGFSARRGGQGALVGVEPLGVETGQNGGQREGVRQLHAGVVVLDGGQVLDDGSQELSVEFHDLKI